MRAAIVPSRFVQIMLAISSGSPSNLDTISKDKKNAEDQCRMKEICMPGCNLYVFPGL